MKPKKPPQENRQKELFRTELIHIIDPRHSLVKLAKVVDWAGLDELFDSTYCPDNGRPGVSTRLMVSLHYLKYTYNLSDEDIICGWVENPYSEKRGHILNSEYIFVNFSKNPLFISNSDFIDLTI
jgi:IS5 family transposase